MSEIFNIGAEINLRKIMTSRLLIQGAPGSGKSYAVRQCAETFSGAVQQIVFDPEGEFVTLREKFPFALVAREGGDIPLNVDHAAILAETILRTKLSVIIDLYDLKAPERLNFVGDFFQAMMIQPKEEWHDVLTYVDEAQIFCPEGKTTHASDQIIDYATRGRKRGYGLIMATLRLALLDKGVAAMLANKMIGLTTMDIDVARAAFDLGMTKKEIKQMGISRLPPGNFFAMGPAFNALTMFEFKTSPVQTTHLEPGQNAIYRDAIPAPDAIRGILETLKDLPAEADRRLETEADLREEIRMLRADTRDYAALEAKYLELQRTHTAPAKGALTVMEEMRKAANKELEIARENFKSSLEYHRAENSRLWKQLAMIRHQLRAIQPGLRLLIEGTYSLSPLNRLQNMYGGIHGHEQEVHEPGPLKPRKPELPELPELQEARENTGVIWSNVAAEPVIEHKVTMTEHNGPLEIPVPNWVQEMDAAIMESVPPAPAAPKPYSKCEKAILGLLAQFSVEKFTRWQIAFATGYSDTSGSYGQSLSRLEKDGLIEKQGEEFRISLKSDHRLEILDITGKMALENQHITARSYDKVLDNCSLRIITLLRENAGTVYERSQIAARLGYSETSGSFGQSIGYLIRLRLIIKWDKPGYTGGYTLNNLKP